MDRIAEVIKVMSTLGPRVLTWLNGSPGRKRAIGAALMGIGTALKFLGYSDIGVDVEGLNDLLQAVSNASDLFGLVMYIWGHAHNYLRKKDEMPVEWTTIANVPELKEIPKPAPEVVAQRTVSYEEIDVQTKEDIPVGTRIRASDGREGVVMLTKSRSAAGYTYAVRVEKR